MSPAIFWLLVIIPFGLDVFAFFSFPMNYELFSARLIKMYASLKGFFFAKTTRMGSTLRKVSCFGWDFNASSADSPHIFLGFSIVV